MSSQRPDRVKRAPCKDPAPPRFIFRSISAEATVTTSRQSSQSKTGALSESELLTFRGGEKQGTKINPISSSAFQRKVTSVSFGKDCRAGTPH